MFLSLLLASILTSPVARADDACAHPKNTYDRTYCMAKLFLEADKEMGVVYKDLGGAVKPDEKKKLVTAQRHWIEFRNNACEANGSIDVDCNYKVNKERTEYLRDRLRECKTGHCDGEKLFTEGWQKPAKG